MSHPLWVGCKVYTAKTVESWGDGYPGGRHQSLCPISVVEFLLYRGKADLTVLDENKNTALHLACSKVLPGVGSGVA